MTGQKTKLDMFIPEDRRQALSKGETLPTRTHGAVLFADISGFTKLTSILSTELGAQRGAEELIRQLSPIYTSLVDAIHNFRGSVIVISGDGITCWFDQDDGRRATTCAFAMQKIMAQYETITLPTGQGISLGIKIALSVGPVQRFLVGDPDIQLLEALAGHELDQVGSAQQLLEKGEIAVSAKLLKKIEGEVIVRSWRQTSEVSSFAVIDEKTELAEGNPWPEIMELDNEVARKWVFASIYNRIKDEEIEFLTELRQAVPMFLKFTGLDYDHDENAGEKLDQFVRRVQSVLAHYEGYLCQLTIGDKGSNVAIAFGAPIAHEDNINRALTAALKLKEEIGKLGYVQPLQIGLTHGQVWAGPNGGERARTYSVMGAEVNLSARLMSHAKAGEILVSPHIVEIATNFSFAPLAPINFKGMQKPMTPYRLVGKARAQSASSQQNIMFGRDLEQGILAQKLIDLTSRVTSQSGGMILIEGEAGIGKSRLLADFVEKAKQMGVKALTGYGDPVERSTQYYGIRPVFETLFGVSDEEDLFANQQKVLSAIQGNTFLMERVPLLSEVMPLRLPDNHLTAQMVGEARATSIREFLLGILRHMLFKNNPPLPFIIMLDDAHLLDAATWNLIGYINRELPGILLAIAMRPIEAGEIGMQNEEEYRRLRADPKTIYIGLQALPEDEIIALVARKLGVKGLPASILTFIQVRAQGNPFFSEEIAYALRDAEVIQLENDEALVHIGAEELNRIDFPRTIQGVITSRIDRLSPAHQLTLKVASVIGRAFLINMLSNVHPSRTKISTLVEYLTTLTQLGITELETPTPELTYLFKHLITQEVVYNLLTFAQRKQLHCAIAEWCEMNYAEELSPYYSRLAHHWLKGEEWEKAIYYLDKAGEQALELYSNEDAIRFISIAGELEQKNMERTGHAKIGFLGRLQHARRERMLGMAHSALGHLPEAQMHLSRTLELLGRAMPKSNVGLTLNLLKELIEQISHRIFPGQLGRTLSDEQRAIEEELARVDIEEIFYYSQNNILLAWGILRRLNLAERLGIPGLMAEGYSNLEMMAGLAALEGVRRHYQKLTANALQNADSLSTRIYAHLREAIVQFVQCDWEGADKNLETGIQLSAQLGDTHQRAVTTATLATSLYLQGKFESAFLHWKAIYQKVAHTEEVQTKAFSLYGQGHNLLMLGLVEEAIRVLEASLQVPMKNADDKILDTSRYGALSLAYFRKGDFDKALENIIRHQQLAPASPALSSLMNEYDAVFDSTLGLWKNVKSGTYEPTKTELAQLQQAVHRIPRILKTLRRLPANKAKICLYEGIHSNLIGNHQRAVDNWNKCIELAEHYHQPYELGRAHYEMGLYADNLDRVGHLKKAYIIFRDLHTGYELEFVKTALEQPTSA